MLDPTKTMLTGFFALSLCAVFAQTSITSDIIGNTTWNLAGSPYSIDADIQVDVGITLIVDPGVTVIHSYPIVIGIKNFAILDDWVCSRSYSDPYFALIKLGIGDGSIT